FFAKYDGNGNYLWAKSIEGVGTSYSRSIVTDEQNNVYVTGNYLGTVDFDPGPGAATKTVGGIFFAKYDSSGNFVWANDIDVGSNNHGERIIIDESGNVCIIGTFGGSNIDFDPGIDTALLSAVGAFDVFLAKYDSSGSYLWAHNIGSTALDYGYDIASDAFNNIYITGKFSSTADFDPGTGVANLTSNGSWDIFFAKYDSSGNYIWANNIGGVNDDSGYGITTEANGSVYITGYFKDVVDFDPGVDSLFLTSGGLRDLFYGKYSSNGSFLWAKGVAAAGDQYGLDITVDSSDFLYLTGYFYNTVDFDPETGTSNLISNGLRDIFIAKYSTCSPWVSNESVAICENDSVLIFGNYQVLSGVYHDSLFSVNGCDSVLAKTLIVNPTSSITTPDETICEGDSIIVFGIYRKTAGTYYDSLITLNSCDSVISTMLTVDPLPNVGFMGLDTDYCIDDVLFTDTLIGSPPGGTFAGPGIVGNVFDPNLPGLGTFTITYTYTDGNGCTNSTSQDVTVNNCTDIEIIKGVDVLKIYPNPSTDWFTLEVNMQKTDILSIGLYSTNDQQMYSKEIDGVTGNYKQQIDLGGYAKGVYYIKIVTDHYFLVEKVIIQ
ncbi:MAG: T9SS type A sorting domain-containing protein, partial [Flavobacteriales bacterium]|nr:T9SS type A sorting domain-containing protein [Flavobacteriales bacterium]